MPTRTCSARFAAAGAALGRHPRYNFIGGHNDRSLIPIEGLIEATASVLRREGSKLALYNLAQGPQGYRGLREFVADKLERAIAASRPAATTC